MSILVMFQTQWRKAVENPSYELRQSKWMERATGLVDVVESGKVLAFEREKKVKRRKRSRRKE